MNSSAALADCSWWVYTNSRADYRVVARSGSASPEVDQWIARLAKLVDPAIKPGFETIVGIAVSPNTDSINQTRLLAFRAFDAGTFMARPHTLAIVAIEMSAERFCERSLAALLASLPTPRPDSEEYDFPLATSHADFSRQPAALAALDDWLRSSRIESTKLPVVFSSPPEITPNLQALNIHSLTNNPASYAGGQPRSFWIWIAGVLVAMLGIAVAVTLLFQPARNPLTPDAEHGTATPNAAATNEQLLATLAKVHIDLPSNSSHDHIVRATLAAATDAERRMQSLHDELAESPANSHERADISERHLRHWKIGLDVSEPTPMGANQLSNAQITLLRYRDADEELTLLAKRSPSSVEFTGEVERLIARLAPQR